jgi:hypothetical protein
MFPNVTRVPKARGKNNTASNMDPNEIRCLDAIFVHFARDKFSQYPTNLL